MIICNITFRKGCELFMRKRKEYKFTLNEIIGQKIRNARISAGLTLDELSKMTGISAAQLSSLETGYRRANIDTLYAIAKAIGIDVSNLLKYGDDTDEIKVIDKNIEYLLHEWEEDNRKQDVAILLREFRQLTPEELRQLVETVKTFKKR